MHEIIRTIVALLAIACGLPLLFFPSPWSLE